MDPDNLTSDHSKAPKPVKFGLVVAAACVTLLVLIAAAYLLLRNDGTKLVPHTPEAHPTSYVRDAGVEARG